MHCVCVCVCRICMCSVYPLTLYTSNDLQELPPALFSARQIVINILGTSLKEFHSLVTGPIQLDKTFDVFKQHLQLLQFGITSNTSEKRMKVPS